MASYSDYATCQTTFWDKDGNVVGRTPIITGKPHVGKESGLPSVMFGLKGGPEMKGANLFSTIYVGPDKDAPERQALNADRDVEAATAILSAIPSTADKAAPWLVTMCKMSTRKGIKALANHPPERIVAQLAAMANVPAEGLYPA